MLKDTLGCMWVGAADLSDTWTQIKILIGLARGASKIRFGNWHSFGNVVHEL